MVIFEDNVLLIYWFVLLPSLTRSNGYTVKGINNVLSFKKLEDILSFNLLKT